MALSWKTRAEPTPLDLKDLIKETELLKQAAALTIGRRIPDNSVNVEAVLGLPLCLLPRQWLWQNSAQDFSWSEGWGCVPPSSFLDLTDARLCHPPRRAQNTERPHGFTQLASRLVAWRHVLEERFLGAVLSTILLKDIIVLPPPQLSLF